MRFKFLLYILLMCSSFRTMNRQKNKWMIRLQWFDSIAFNSYIINLFNIWDYTWDSIDGKSKKKFSILHSSFFISAPNRIEKERMLPMYSFINESCIINFKWKVYFATSQQWNSMSHIAFHLIVCNSYMNTHIRIDGKRIQCERIQSRISWIQIGCVE